jgi:hypothetical protein
MDCKVTLVASGRIDDAVRLGVIAAEALARGLEDPTRKLSAAIGLIELGDKRGVDGAEMWLTQALAELRAFEKR